MLLNCADSDYARAPPGLTLVTGPPACRMSDKARFTDCIKWIKEDFQMTNILKNFRGHGGKLFAALLVLVLFCTVFPLSGSAEKTPEPGTKYVNVLGNSVSSATRRLDLSEMAPEDVPDVLAKLPEFKELTMLVLSKPDSNGEYPVSKISFEDFQKIAEAVPNAKVIYTFEFYGQKITTTGTLDIKFKQLTKVTDETLDEIRELVPYLYNLKTISFDRCGTSDEALAELREELGEQGVLVRWRVFFGPFCAWSDCEKIWAMAGIYDDEKSENIKYFSNLKYLDLGHSGMTTCEYLYGTPDVEVLILACGSMADITPVGSLKKLRYLEICDTDVSDISMLAECENLVDINLGGTQITDLSPLFGLKNIKRLYAGNLYSITDAQREEYEAKFKELFPDAEIDFSMGDSGGTLNGHWRYSRGAYTGHFVEQYEEIREIFGYDDNMEQAYLFD